MARKLIPLKEALLTDFPTKEDFRQKLVCEPEHKLREIQEAIDACRNCIVAGPPRSGKTTLVRSVGWKQRHKARVWCLDMIDLLNAKDVKDSTRFTNLANRLYIIENWHAAPRYRQNVEDAVKRCNKARFIITSTTFSEEEQHQVGERFPNTFIVSVKPQELARGIIEKYVDGFIRDTHRRVEFLARLSEAPSDHKPSSERDYKACLWLEKGEKKIRGNLRLLRYRLEAWDPRVRPLWEVALRDIKVNLRRESEKIEWALPFLWQVATICQWEIPYLLKGSHPVEADDLVQRNILKPIPGGWRMDSTDAYLFLRSQYNVNRWKEKTTESLMRYMKEHKEQSLALMSSLSRDPVGKRLLSQLLEDKENIGIVQEEIRVYITDAAQNNSSAGLVFSLIRGLEGKGDGEESKRLAMAECLLQGVDASRLGELAQRNSLQTIGRFVRMLVKDPSSRFDNFLLTFLCAHGLDELQTKLEDTSNGQVQRKFLQQVGYLEPALREWLRSNVILKPLQPSKINMSKTIGWLRHVLWMHGNIRRRRVNWISSVDKEDLIEAIRNSPIPLKALGRLQFIANWLDSAVAKRISEWVPELVASLPVVEEDAATLSLLIKHCRMANEASAQRLVGVLLKEPADKLLPIEVHHGELESIGNFLQEAGLANLDVAAVWCAENARYWGNAIASSTSTDAAYILSRLHRISPDTTFLALETSETQLRGKLSDKLTPSDLPLCGFLALYNLALPKASLPSPDEIVRELTGKVTTSEMILVIYVVQSTFGTGTARALTEGLILSSAVSPALALNLARHSTTWTAEDVSGILNALVSGQINEVKKAMHTVVLFYMTHFAEGFLKGVLLDDIEGVLEQGGVWSPAAFDRLLWEESKRKSLQTKIELRWLHTAIHEGVLKRTYSYEGGQPLWKVNEEHMLARNATDRTQKVLNTLWRTQDLHNQERLDHWDTMLGIESIGIPEADYWRRCLIEVGAIRHALRAGDQPYAIDFSLVQEHPLVRRMIH